MVSGAASCKAVRTPLDGGSLQVSCQICVRQAPELLPENVLLCISLVNLTELTVHMNGVSASQC